MNPKRNRKKYIAAVIIFVIGFRTFQYYPGLSFLREIAVGLGVLSYGIMLVSLIKNGRTNSSNVFILICIPSLLVVSTVSANVFSGQSLTLGFISERTLFLIPLCYLLGRFICEKCNHKMFCKLSLHVGWFCLSLYFFQWLLLDPASFDGQYLGYAGLVKNGVAAWQFDFIPIVMLLSVSLFNGYIFSGLAAVTFTLFFGGRILMVALIGSYLIILFKKLGTGRIGVKSMMTVSGTIVVVLTTLFFASDSANVIYKFSELSAFVSGEEVGDTSLLTRVNSFSAVLPIIQESNLWGIGKLAQNNDQIYFGKFFHAGDLGVVGAIFRYGELPTGLLIGYVLILWWSVYRNLDTNSYSTFYVATFFLLTSIPAGSFWFRPETLGFTIGTLSIILRDMKSAKLQKALSIQEKT